MSCPSKNRGRRECRVPNAPAASRAKMKKHDELVTTGSPDQARHSPRNGFNGLLRALLGVPGLLATVVPGLRVRELDASVGASGPHVYILVFGETRRNYQSPLKT